MEARQSHQVFRPHRVLALLMAISGAFWAFALGWLLTFNGVPLKLLVATGLFAAFFALGTLYYGRTHVLVDQGGVTYRGMLRTKRFIFGDIRRVDVFPGPITVYAIRGHGDFCHFTSFFPGHRTLAELLVQRANLGPVRG